MSATDDVDRLIERYDLALGEFVKGDPEPVKELFSRKADVTLANPLGTPALGADEVSKTLEHAATTIRDGEILDFETGGKMGASEEITPFALRVTMIFRPEEEGEWKVVHRHADPITSARPAESVIQE